MSECGFTAPSYHLISPNREMRNPAPSVESNSKWQLGQRLDGEKKQLGGRGRGDRFEPPELTGELWGWIGAFRWTSFFSLFPDPHEVLAGEKTLPPPLLLPFLWCRATSGLAEWTPAAIALPCYRIQSKPQYGPDGNFFQSFWENSMRWGLWWPMNYAFIAFLTFRSCGSCVLTNKCARLSGAVRDIQLQPREKSEGLHYGLHYITFFGFGSSFCKRDICAHMM